MPVHEDAQVPDLRTWEWTEGSKLKGRVHGRDGYSPGQRMTTSRIFEFSPEPAASSALEAEVDLDQPAEAAGARLRHFHVLTAESVATMSEGALVVSKKCLYMLGAPRPLKAPQQAAPAPYPPQLPTAEGAPPAACSPPNAHASGLAGRLPRDTGAGWSGASDAGDGHEAAASGRRSCPRRGSGGGGARVRGREHHRLLPPVPRPARPHLSAETSPVR